MWGPLSVAPSDSPLTRPAGPGRRSRRRTTSLQRVSPPAREPLVTAFSRPREQPHGVLSGGRGVPPAGRGRAATALFLLFSPHPPDIAVARWILRKILEQVADTEGRRRLVNLSPVDAGAGVGVRDAHQGGHAHAVGADLGGRDVAAEVRQHRKHLRQQARPVPAHAIFASRSCIHPKSKAERAKFLPSMALASNPAPNPPVPQQH